MAEATSGWQCLDEETLPPLERLLPDAVYQALQAEIKRQRAAVPPASGSGIEHLNTIPANYEEALKKATILMDRTLCWRRLCFVYEVGEREARHRYLTLAKRNEELERRHQEDQQTIRRLKLRLKSLLKIPESPRRRRPTRRKRHPNRFLLRPGNEGRRSGIAGTLVAFPRTLISRKPSPLHSSARTVGTRIWLAWKPMMTGISKIFHRFSRR